MLGKKSLAHPTMRWTLIVLVTMATSATAITTEACDAVQDKLLGLYQHKPKDLTRVLYYLGRDSAKGGGGNCDVLYKLATKSGDSAFKAYADLLVEDTKTAKGNEAFESAMWVMQQQMLIPRGDSKWFARRNVDSVWGLAALSRAWSKIPTEAQTGIVSWTKKMVPSPKFLAAVDGSVWLLDQAGPGTLAVVQLTWDAIDSLWDWHDGRITGKWCAKTIVDSMAIVAGGVAGGAAGAAAGAAICPGVCLVIGGSIGTVVGLWSVDALVDHLTAAILNVPRRVALEEAYRFFQIDSGASNNEVNEAYRRMTKGLVEGNTKMLLEVQINMQIIRMQRGSSY